MGQLLSERKPALHAALRTATAAAHTRLETSLALLDPPLEAAHFLSVLQGFFGFHRAWEPLLAQQAALAPHLAGRSKLAVLQQDLLALGMSEAAIAALPACPQAQILGGSAMRMLGGLYVLEGSTLGGQVIGRALQTQPWLPAGGLQYFSPYGAQTGAMWRALCAALDAASSPEADAEIIAGAQDTFGVLTEWLPPRSSGSP